MPEFNFAEENEPKREGNTPPEGESSGDAGAPSRRRLSDALPKDLQKSPSRVANASSNIRYSALQERTSSTSSEALRAYMEMTRRKQQGEASTGENDASGSGDDRTRQTGSRSDESRETGDETRAKSLKGPLIAFAIIILFFTLLSFIWFWEPFPALKKSLQGFLGLDGQTETAHVAPALADTLKDAPPPTSREWDYYLQISTWRDQPRAQAHANQFRRSGIDAVVESEYIPRARRTLFRVRLGPFPDRQSAAGLKDSLAARIDPGAFIDSVRISGEEPARRQPPVAQPVMPIQKKTSPGIRVGYEPSRGFAVKVSSFKTSASATSEAARLLKRGFPAFVSQVTIAGTAWYRTYVGPFTTRSDAEKYARLITDAFGNDAVVTDFQRRTQ